MRFVIQLARKAFRQAKAQTLLLGQPVTVLLSSMDVYFVRFPLLAASVMRIADRDGQNVPWRRQGIGMRDRASQLHHPD